LIAGIAKHSLFDRDDPSGGESDLILSIHRNGPDQEGRASSAPVALRMHAQQ
jgi:replicative DNA helicase